MPNYRPLIAASGLAVLLSTLSVAGPGVGDEYLGYTGRATAVHSQAFLYGEKHLLVERGGRVAERVVLYTCRDGSPFARKSVSYVDAFVPNFTLEDTSNGMREGIREEGSKRAMFFRAAGAASEKSRELPHAPNMVADAGFDEFVRANWEPLTTEKTMSVDFLLPSRLDDMGFKIEALRSDHLNGVPVQVFRLRLGAVVGWVFPGIDVYYGVKDHGLMRYVGLSDLRDASGHNLNVDISFDPKDRAPSGRDEIESALKAKLAPCT